MVQFLPPANEVCEGYVFTRICHSVHRGGGVPGPKSENKRHERLESRVTHRVYQSCDSLCTCAEAVQFSLHGKVKFHFFQKYGWESGEGLLQKHKGYSRNK